MFEKDLAHTMKQQRLLLQKDKQRERELGVTLERIEQEHLRAAESLERLYDTHTHTRTHTQTHTHTHLHTYTLTRFHTHEHTHIRHTCMCYL
jgi:hypothetical protein